MNAALLVQGLITLCAAGAGAFLSEYFRTRGKNLATKADFDELQRQLGPNWSRRSNPKSVNAIGLSANGRTSVE
jgi:hypothetical protein